MALCINERGKSDGKLSEGSEQNTTVQPETLATIHEEGVTPCYTVIVI